MGSVLWAFPPMAVFLLVFLIRVTACHPGTPPDGYENWKRFYLGEESSNVCFSRGYTGQLCLHPRLCHALADGSDRFSICQQLFSCQTNYFRAHMSDEQKLFHSIGSWADNLFMTVDEMKSRDGNKKDGGDDDEDEDEDDDRDECGYQRQPVMETQSSPVRRHEPEELQVEDVENDVVPGTLTPVKTVGGCCPTRKFYVANKTLVNKDKVEKRIVHFTTLEPAKYQFIPHGICANEELPVTKRKSCVQGKIHMSLLVYDYEKNPPLAFDTFYIPSFCDCVNR